MIPYRERWQRSEGGVYTRAPHMMGMGMGVGFSAPPPWTPAALNPSLWMGAYEEARATRATQIALVDGDMEAVGTAAWTALYGATTLTKEPGAPSGSGSRVIRIASAGMADAAQFAAWTPGLRERYRVWARASSNARLAITDQISVNVGFAATTDWQHFTVDQTFTGPHWRDLQKPVAPAWAEFDEWTMEVLSLTSYTPKIGAALTQATATAMPWSAALGMMFDGDLLPWGGAADAKCMHTGDGGSLGWQYRPTTLKAENRIIATAATAVGNVGVTVSCTNANTIRVRIMNGGAAYDYDSGDVACNIAINTTYTMVLRVASGAGGVSLRVNGTEVISGALTAPSAANATTGLMLGGDAVGAATNVTGYVGKALLVTRALTVAECAQFEAYCASGATL